ncbi:MAG: hypothetical protein WC924_03145 [Candidatus Gracilibacteria bacterium]
MPKKDETRTAIKFLPSAKNNLIDKSKIYGKVEMDGEGNKITRSLIDVRNSIKEHPIKSTLIGLIIVVFGLIIEYAFFK